MDLMEFLCFLKLLSNFVGNYIFHAFQKLLVGMI